MTLPLHPTLQELRNEVLLRCGYSITGNQAAGVIPVCDSYVAGSEKELFPECEWLKAGKRTTVDIAEDDSTADWPDDAAPGEITAISVVYVNDDDEEALCPMQSGARLQERDLAGVESGQPIVYEYVNEIIYFYPPAGEDYVRLEIDYRLAPTLVQPTDRTVVDGELLVQRATFKMKEYLGLPIGQKEVADHERFLARLRAANSNRSGIQIGGHKSHKVRPHLKNRVGDVGPSNGFDNFHPW